MLLAIAFLLIQSAEVEGTIKRAGTREPLAHASVAVITLAGVKLAETDINGNFRITDLPAGEGEIAVDEIAHEHLSQAVTLADGERTHVTLFLRVKVTDAFETFVVGKKDRAQISQVTLTRPEILRSPGSFGDPLRAVQNLPGIARAPLFLGTLNMRGTLGRDSQVLLEGTPMPQLYHMGIGPAVLPDMLIEDITFNPGTFNASYGRSIGGIIDVKLREPAFERLRGRASVDLLMAAAFIEIPFGKKTSLALSFRRSYLDGLIAPISPLFQGVVPIPAFTDYHVRLVHDFDRLGRLDILAFGTIDNMTFLGKGADQYPKPLWSFQALHPSWTLKGETWNNKLSALGVYVDNSISIPQWDFDAETFMQTPKAPLVARTLQWQLFVRDDLRVSLHENVKLNVGFDIGSINDRVTANVPRVSAGSEDPLSDLVQVFDVLQRPAQPQQWVGSFAAFATLDLRLGPMRISPGVRMEVFSFERMLFPAVQPRLQLSFDLHPAVRLLLSSGYYVKPPALETFYTQSDVDRRQTMASWQSAAGVEWQITQAITLTATGYFNYLFRDVVRTYTSPLNAFSLFDQATAQDTRADGRIYGGELFVRHRPYKNLFASLAYSFSRSERHERAQWVVAQVDQTHTLSLLASYVLPLGWQVGARFRLSSGQPYTPAVGGVWNNFSYDPIYSVDRRSARLPMYHQLDVRFDKTWTFDLWKLTFYVDVMNVYFSQLLVGAGYSFDYQEQRPQQVTFPFLPMVGFQGDF